jgi:CMP-N,N'-diacetyllegionaminic acid synthase
MTSTLAVIPARAGSKRLKNKNSLPFLGKPLILWTVDFAIKFGGFDLVMVTTDSPEIADLARNAGAYVPWLRPDELASDTATSMDVVLHSVDNVNSRRYNFERVALLQPTSPIRLPERWVQAFEFLDQGAPAAIGVHAAASHPYWTYFMGEQGELSPFFPHGMTNRSQDLPSAFVPNGALYLTGIDSLRTYRTFTPPGTRGVVCTERVESIDIDTAEDWSAAELLSREYFK